MYRSRLNALNQRVNPNKQIGYLLPLVMVCLSFSSLVLGLDWQRTGQLLNQHRLASHKAQALLIAQLLTARSLQTNQLALRGVDCNRAREHCQQLLSENLTTTQSIQWQQHHVQSQWHSCEQASCSFNNLQPLGYLQLELRFEAMVWQRFVYWFATSELTQSPLLEER